MNTGEILKNLRKEHGFTQEEVGRYLGITKSAIQKYESGEVKNIKLETIKKLCSFYDVMPFTLIFPEYTHFEPIRLSQTFNPDYVSFMQRYDLLSHTGKAKVLNYMNDMLLIPHYRIKK